MAIRKLIVAICVALCVLPKFELRLPPNRLYIPSVGINVGIGYGYDVYERQPIVDEQNTACLYYWDSGTCVIADHNTQGFATLPDVQIGDTAFLVDEYGNLTALVCIAVIDGINNDILYADDGRDLTVYQYITYTCYGVNDGIRLCMWEVR